MRKTALRWCEDWLPCCACISECCAFLSGPPTSFCSCPVHDETQSERHKPGVNIKRIKERWLRNLPARRGCGAKEAWDHRCNSQYKHNDRLPVDSFRI